MDRSTLDSSLLYYLPEFSQILVRWVSDTIQPSHPLPAPFSSCLQSFPTSGSFPMSRALHIRWPEYWNFSFSISPSSGCSGLISLRINWFGLLAAISHQIFCSFTHSPCSVPVLLHLCLWPSSAVVKCPSGKCNKGKDREAGAHLMY